LSYTRWARGNPLLEDPTGDADSDGDSNELEYGAGTNALDAASRVDPRLSVEDLTELGFSDQEIVFSMMMATNADDASLYPSTSTDLSTWAFSPLKFLDAIDLGKSKYELRFRLTDTEDPARFFRFEASDN
jgi:hypothetical protein